MRDILIVYYSRTGKTRLVAERLALLLDADVAEITERKSREGVLGYLGAGKDAVLKRDVELVSCPGVAGRKVVMLGMPVWGFNPPPAMRTWLKRTDLSGCKVCAFATMDGSGAERTLAKVAEIIGAPLAATLGLLKPRADDPALDAKLQEFVRQVTRE